MRTGILGVVRAAKRPHLVAAAPGQLAYPGFVYNGGPVIASPNVYTSFWGSLWSDSSQQSAAQRLSQFAEDLLASDFMNVLSQYGAGTGKGSGSFVQASFVANVPGQLADADIQNVIQSSIDVGVIPEPPAGNTSDVLIIYLDENTEVNDPDLGIVMCEPSGDTAFGYHNSFTTTAGNPFYYAVVPALDDACLQNSCGGDTGCTLQLSESQEQRRTQVASHEFAEMVTDPNPPTGWYDESDANSGENGDICNGESDPITGTTSANVWTVQKIYSKYDDQQSGGTDYCLAQAPAPEPLLTNGPAAGMMVGDSSLLPLLPLPSARFDYRTRKVRTEAVDLNRHVERVCQAMGRRQSIPGLAAYLRAIAARLERASTQRA